MTNALATCLRAALLASIALLAACSHERSDATAEGSSGAAAPATVYPAGLVPPADWAGSRRAGIYPSDTPKTCCFLAGTSLLVLDNPPGSQLAVFTFYIPSVEPLTKNHERVVVRFNGKPAGPPAELSPGMQDVTVTIPAPLRRKRHLPASLAMSIKWVPKNIGLNDDRRELSIMLIRVGYI